MSDRRGTCCGIKCNNQQLVTKRGGKPLTSFHLSDIGPSMNIDLLSIFIHCCLNKRRKNKKYLCPFCNAWDFELQVDDSTCSCGNCDYSGNSVELYAKLKGIPKHQSFRELTKLLEDGTIWLYKRTRKEAVEKLSKDLEFLSYVRMYWAFYGHNRENQQYHQRNSGIAESPFNRVVNGDIGNVAKEPWNMAIAYLKSQINIDEFKTVLAAGPLHFEPEANELLHSKTQLKKFQ